MKCHLLVYAMTFVFLVSVSAPMNVSADPLIGYKFCTFMPSANNSTFHIVVPPSDSDCLEVEAAGDSSTKTLSGENAYIITTSDYYYIPPIRGNPLGYIDYFPDVGGTVDKYYPTYAMPGQTIPENPDWATNTSDADIIRVMLCAAFIGTVSPWSALYFSNDTGTSWRLGQLYPSLTTIWTVNITSWEDWTVELLHSSALAVKFATSVLVGASYTIDYLGLVVYWEVENPNPPEGWEEGGGSISLSIISIMGVVGFIGLVALFPATIIAYRNHEGSRIVLFVKMLAAGMFCLTMFMVSITA